MTDVGRALPVLSPSGFTLWNRCNLKWWYEKWQRRRSPTQPHQQVGKDVHARNEGFLLTGEWPAPVDDPIGKIARAGEKYLVDLREAVEERGALVEHEFVYPEGWNGSALRIYCLADLVEFDPPFITDHKTTGDIYSPYVPSSRTLRTDPQMLWYGWLAFLERRPPTFGMRHIYYQTKNGQASREVACETEWVLAEVNAERFIRASHDMRAACDVEEAAQVPWNLDECGAFGGCPHKSYCPAHKNRGLPGGIVNFRERQAAKRAEAAKADQAEDAKHIGEGQVVPPDTPGTETPTDEALDEIAGIVFDNLPDSADRAEIATWLAREGKPHLISAGLATTHIRLVCDYIDRVNASGGDEQQPAETPAAKPAEAPAADEQQPAETPPPKLTGKAAKAAQRRAAWPGIVAYLEAQGGHVRVEDVGLRDLIKDATGSGRLSSKQRITFLGEMVDAGEGVSYNAVHVFVGDEAPEIGTADPPPAAAPEPAAPAAAAPAELPPEPAPAEVTNGVDPGVPAIVVCIAAHPSGGDELTLDNVLDDYYTAVAEANNVPDYTLVDFAKGPGLVFAMCGPIEEIETGQTWVTMSPDHPMAKYVTRLFPTARFVRGLR